MRKNRNLLKKSKKVYSIIVDGYCEVWYFQMMKRNEPSILVDILPKIPQKKGLEEQYKTVLEASKHYDKVFWVVDYDVLHEESKKTPKGKKSAIQDFKEYYNKATKIKNVSIAVNNPCLEFWFLLHYEPTGKFHENCESALKQLKKHLKDYEKTQPYFTKKDNDIYLKLKNHQKAAISNAKKLGKINLDNPRTAICEMFIFFAENGNPFEFPL